MKLSFTFMFIALVTNFGLSQDLTFNESAISIGADGIIDFGELIVTNNTTTNSIELAIRLERVCLHSSDETRISIVFVIGFSLVNETTTWGQDSEVPFYVLEPGQSYDEITFRPLPTGAYESEWNLVIYDRNNPTTEAVVNVKIEGEDLLPCSATSTIDFNYEVGKAYPNPVLETISIPYEIDVNEANLNIYNSTGTLLKSVTLSAEADQIEVNVAEFVSGVYFYNITDGKDQSKMMSFVK